MPKLEQDQLRRVKVTCCRFFAASHNTTVTPAGVFLRGVAAVFPNDKDNGIGNHAEAVAGIMIAGKPGPISVSPGASLLSTTGGDELSMQKLISSGDGKIRALNCSFNPLYFDPTIKFDGSSPLTKFIDWSARAHNIVYVVSGNENRDNAIWPADNYNGITVGASSQIDGTYRR